MKKVNRKKGFTLIELIVVIAILGILAAIAVPRLTGQMDNARAAARATNVRTLNGAVAVYLVTGTNTMATLEATGGAAMTGNTHANAETVYNTLVGANVIQSGLTIQDTITYNVTNHAFE